jgi:hypothetical protein
MKIIGTEGLRVPKNIEVVDLLWEKEIAIEISSDHEDFFDINGKQDKMDKDVLAWAVANEDPLDPKKN